MSHPTVDPAPSGRAARVNPDAATIPAYIIGIPARYRGGKLEEQLRERGMPFEFSEGVVIGDRSPHLVDDITGMVFTRRRLTSGEVGGGLAHRRVYQKMISADQPVALVFEDDARLTGTLDIPRILGLLDTRTPRVLLLSHNPVTAVADRRSYASASEDNSIVRAIFPPTIATAYALNDTAAKLLIDEDRPISHVPDWPVRPAPFVEFYVMMRPPAAPDATTESVIGNRVPPKPPSLTRRLLRRSLTVAHVRWLIHRRRYGTYRAYVLHELVRMRAIRRATRIVARRTDTGDRRPVRSSLLDNAIARLWIGSGR